MAWPSQRRSTWWRSIQSSSSRIRRTGRWQARSSVMSSLTAGGSLNGMALPLRSQPRARPSAPLPIVILAGAGAAFFIIPLIGLLLRTPWTSAWNELGSPEVLTALRLSLLASFSATAIALVLGVPLAWPFARLTFPARSVLRALTVLPMVLPPVVGGVALLLAFGRRGLLGGWCVTTFGFHLPFSTPRRQSVDRPLEGHLAAGAAVAHRRRGPLLGPGARRVRRDDHVCREFPGPDADDAAGRLPRTGDQPRRRHCPQPRTARGLAGGVAWRTRSLAVC